MAKLSLKQFLLVFTGIGFGVGLLCAIPHREYWIAAVSDWGNVPCIICAAAGAMIGSGIGVLFKAKTLKWTLAGAITGLSIFIWVAMKNISTH